MIFESRREAKGFFLDDAIPDHLLIAWLKYMQVKLLSWIYNYAKRENWNEIGHSKTGWQITNKPTYLKIVFQLFYSFVSPAILGLPPNFSEN